jgi:tRNA(Ile)-lysidine synthase
MAFPLKERSFLFMTDLLEKYERFIRAQKLFLPGSRILIAVSGGMDSMALLDLFSMIRKSWSLRLAAAHVQHGIRGEEAEDDEAFVAATCRHYGLPFLSAATDAPSYCRTCRVSLETGSRLLRHSILTTFASRLCFDFIALAHQADDQAETILLNLIRGAGLRGMAGMRARRDMFVRPLLFATRQEIEIHCRMRKLFYRMDSTNLDTSFRRNRMRWRILSNLKHEFGEHVTGSICRAGDAVREAESVMEHHAIRAFRKTVRQISPDEIALDIHQFLQYFKGIQKAVLIHLFEAVPFIGRRPGRIELERLLWLAEYGKSGSGFPLARAVVVVKSGFSLIIQRKHGRGPVVPVEIGRPVVFQEAEIRFTSKMVPWHKDKTVVRNNPNVAFLDGEAAEPPYALRQYRPGDWFIPLGMTGKKKLHDFFIDQKVPNYRRNHIPLFTVNRGIAWVGGLRLDERFKVTGKTKRVLKLEIEPI